MTAVDDGAVTAVISEWSSLIHVGLISEMLEFSNWLRDDYMIMWS